MFAIKTKNLKKRFGEFWALKGIDLEIKNNQIVSILGPNGAGKTTLLEILEGLQEPTEGEVLILGYSLKEKRKFQSKIGICLQETRFIDKLTVYEILSLFANIYSVKKTRIFEVLELLELLPFRNVYTQNLSGGLRQRLALGVALLHNPEILFLDEPTTGLDPKARRNIWNLLKNLKSSKTTIILTTHYMEEAETLSEFIYLINQGSIVAQGTLFDLYEKFQKNYIIEITLLKKEPLKKLNLLFTEKNIKLIPPNRLQIYLPANKKLAEIIKEYLNRLYQNHIDIQHLEIHKPDLNDIFLTLTGKELNEK